MLIKELHELSDFTINVARQAGKIAMSGFRNRELRVDVKADFHDMVTQYDRACEEYITREVLSAYPESTIVGEEGGAHKGEGKLAWHIDPIDGTANFARGMALWAVSIGVVCDGETIVGVVYDPVNDHLFWADDRGAFFGREPMRSWGFTEPAHASVVCNFPLPRDLVHMRSLALEQYANVCEQFAHVRALGSSAISLCWVAAGWVDATLSFEAHSWDVVASAFIVRQSGGTYTAYWEGDAQPCVRDYEYPHYLASVPGAHFPLLDEIMRTQSRRPLPSNY